VEATAAGFSYFLHGQPSAQPQIPVSFMHIIRLDDTRFNLDKALKDGCK
jgi:hypothetical protein